MHCTIMHHHRQRFGWSSVLIIIVTCDSRIICASCCQFSTCYTYTFSSYYYFVYFCRLILLICGMPDSHYHFSWAKFYICLNKMTYMYTMTLSLIYQSILFCQIYSRFGFSSRCSIAYMHEALFSPFQANSAPGVVNMAFFSVPNNFVRSVVGFVS